MYSPKNHKSHNLQLPIDIIKKSTLSDMRHRKTYMYVNFLQERVSQVRSVKTVHTNLFAIISNCINMQLANRILKNHAIRTCTTP